MPARKVKLLFGAEDLSLEVPPGTDVLVGADLPALEDPNAAVRRALDEPIATPPLRALLAQRRPRRVAITVSDITRPVPNRDLLPPLLELLDEVGVRGSGVRIVIGTGMHRPSTAQERDLLLGPLPPGVEVIDHRADERETLLDLCAAPTLRVNRAFAEADFRIVTGLIEPHFMAGFSGGRKGVCPALVDLETLSRFHSYDTLSHPLAQSGQLEGNPCHAIALDVARRVGVDFLVNVALTRDRRLAGVFAGDLVEAHLAGCAAAAAGSSARIRGTYDLVITSGGGFPLDQTFYQCVKGQVEALPALRPGSVLLQVAHCGEGLGSPAFERLLLEWGHGWRAFLAHLASRRDVTLLDQWELQMQCRVLERVGVGGLWFVSDALAPEIQRRIAVHPILGEGAAPVRAQRALDGFLSARPGARVAVIPDGPYTLLADDRAPSGAGASTPFDPGGTGL